METAGTIRACGAFPYLVPAYLTPIRGNLFSLDQVRTYSGKQGNETKHLENVSIETQNLCKPKNATKDGLFFPIVIFQWLSIPDAVPDART